VSASLFAFEKAARTATGSWMKRLTATILLATIFAAAVPLPAQTAPEPVKPSPQAVKLIAAAKTQVGVTVSYDPAYAKLAYPGGDVPEERGVCTDVVIRAFRALGLDLQQLVHEDMARAFARYPQQWGLSKPDPNIDHRRVPNLMRFFERAGKRLPVTKKPEDYRPGDLVTVIVPKNLPHIMLVADVPSPVEPKRMQIVHNIGAGAQLEDRLFDFEITGHYRYW
jgi:uncharacterized protein YijF (DUF1287 family)